MHPLRVAGIALVLVVAFACGRPAGCQECNQPAAAHVVVTEKDYAVTVHTGQRIDLVLHARSGMSSWSGVTVDDPTVLRSASVVEQLQGVTTAGFEAAKPGTAHIRATATPLCSPNQACPQFAMLFEVLVTVT
jgi:hypothetical protein